MHSKVYNFPSKFIYSVELEKHKEISKRLHKLISIDLQHNRAKYVEQSKQWKCKILTTFFDHTNSWIEQIPELNKVIYEAMQDMCNKVHISGEIKGGEIQKIWYNIYTEGYNQEVHKHCGSDFSGIYILKSTEPNNTVFYADEYSRWFNVTKETKEFKEGTLILFPSHLAHYVTPTISEERITIAFNIKVW